MTGTRARRSGKSGSRRTVPAIAMPLADLLSFWRQELPRLGYEYTLRLLYTPVSPCPICEGQQTYRPEGSTDRLPCFCQLQAQLQEQITGWQDYNFLPSHLQHIERADILSLSPSLTPTQRVQLSLVLKAVDRFIDRPLANQIFVGAAGAHGTLLAAYIAGQLKPLPNIFLSLRQLLDWLMGQPVGEADPIRNLLVNIPVLLIDDFSGAYGEIDEVAAQRLYDLIDYRHSQRLPMVIVSDVMLDQLWAIHPLLLERLQQEADFYIFDPQQIRIRRPTMRSTGQLLSPMPLPVHRCAWLVMGDGAASSGAFPVPDHYCRRVSTLQPIAFAHQASACLSADHTGCPVFRTPDDQAVDALPDALLRKERPPAGYSQPLPAHPAILPMIAGVVLVLVVGGLVMLGAMFPTAAAGSTPRATAAVPTLEPSRTPLPAATLTALPATPAMSTTSGVSDPAEASPSASSTPAIPGAFSMTLQLVDIGSCGYPDMSLDYAFQLGGSRATLTRSGDGLIFSGSYNPATGEFWVSATQSIGTEEISGKITLGGGWLEVSGEHVLLYLDGSCTGQWSVSGRTLVKTSG